MFKKNQSNPKYIQNLTLVLMALVLTIVRDVNSQTYCTPNNETGQDADSDAITSFKLSNLDNSSQSPDFGNNGYTDYTDITPADLYVGESYIAELIGKGSNKHTANIWIDYNDDGEFESSSSERVAIKTGSPTNAMPASIDFPPFVVPDSPGIHRLRVQWVYNNGSNDNLNPCEQISVWGETEDYLVNIISNCSGEPDGGNVSITPLVGTANSSYTVSATGYSLGGGVEYQWQYRINGGSWTNAGTLSQTYSDYNATATSTIGDQIEWRLKVDCTHSNETAYSSLETFTVVMGDPAPGGVSNNLTSWFKASEGVTTSGNQVSKWESTVGNYEVSQSSPEKQPQYFDESTDATKALGINFNSGVYFDGDNDELLARKIHRKIG